MFFGYIENSAHTHSTQKTVHTHTLHRKQCTHTLHRKQCTHTLYTENNAHTHSTQKTVHTHTLRRKQCTHTLYTENSAHTHSTQKTVHTHTLHKLTHIHLTFAFDKNKQTKTPKQEQTMNYLVNFVQTYLAQFQQSTSLHQPENVVSCYNQIHIVSRESESSGKSSIASEDELALNHRIA